MNNSEWTSTEIEIAKSAFASGNKKAESELIKQIQDKSSNLSDIESLYALHDFLSIERHGLEGRSQFDPDTALFAFAEMVKRGLVTVAELDGLEPKKIAKIKAMSMF
ncbi:hypothetical protein MY494_11375 [Synechococcus sp. A10-1-5-1]|uniref:hypothetical protein n=1 Tax=Synechococcus sp. A10-1-5-1 TaxID=2936507 RepID=UPI00200066EA|nr:hypothetical protein [Synechococcus sp. A10-1-5-1]UPM49904.1 hypothetical protein MY494_11375 [Synechococcus sp. A10-1-5-1]